ncbi:MAG: GNAT family N-acetyltransferase [candidate division WOR-3 bacterium]|nr:MAG: GNAT family N-acetyltransferase [candidate division WOR-3 bacterium]
MTKIKIMKTSDITFCKGLTDIEQWGYVEDDFKRLIDYEPNGCFIAQRGDEKVGMITTTSYGTYAFLGSLIVRNDARRKGIGLRLMKRALYYLTKKGSTTIELDGVFPAVMLYQRLGFKDKYLSLRFIKTATVRHKKKSTSHTPQEKISNIVYFDRAKTGLDRAKILERLLNDLPHSVFTIREKDMKAYALIRPRAGDVLMIGPLVSEHTVFAEKLLSKIVRIYSHKTLIIGVPAVNSDAVDMMIRYGFIYKQPSLRMYRGIRMNYERHIYGILSPEKG